MSDASVRAGVPSCATAPGLSAIALLIAVGGLISIAVAVSKLAAERGAPMLGFLALAWLVAAALLAPIALAQRGLAGIGRIAGYVSGAGLLMIVPSAIGYVAVRHVGSGLISFSFAFPVLLTWVLAVALGDRGLAGWKQVAGVFAALAGGMVLTLSKLRAGGLGGELLWTLAVAGIPAALALGNIFRSRYWPAGERPLPLATLSIVTGAIMVLPAAVWLEGDELSALWLTPGLFALVLAAGAVVAAQYVLQFRLQQIAGPVYTSQIGGVAALSGALLSFTVLAETVPPGFWAAAILVAGGSALFHLSSRPGT
ncbi:MAG: DMT family transporter [Rhodobacteraceae bacterium]|nr:DMT family transporter [Paracoccaceae bacterium]